MVTASAAFTPGDAATAGTIPKEADKATAPAGGVEEATAGAEKQALESLVSQGILAPELGQHTAGNGLASVLGESSGTADAPDMEKPKTDNEEGLPATASATVPAPADLPSALSVKAIASLSFLADPLLLRSLSASPDRLSQGVEIPVAALAPASPVAPGDLSGMTLDASAPPARADLPAARANPDLPAPQDMKEAPGKGLTPAADAGSKALQPLQAAEPGAALVLKADPSSVPSQLRPVQASEAPVISSRPAVPAADLARPAIAGKMDTSAAPSAPSAPEDVLRAPSDPNGPRILAVQATAGQQITTTLVGQAGPQAAAAPAVAGAAERQASVQPAAVAGRMAGAALMASPELVPLSRSAGAPVSPRAAAVKMGTLVHPQPQAQLQNLAQTSPETKISTESAGIQPAGILPERGAAPVLAQGISSPVPGLPGAFGPDAEPARHAAAPGTAGAGSDPVAVLSAKPGSGDGAGPASGGSSLPEAAAPGQSASGPDLVPGLSREGLPPQIHHAPAPSHSPLPQALALPQTVATQVARQLQGPGLTGGTTRISLSDESLGELVIELETDDAGQLRILLKAENPALLSTIRADRDTLLQSLNQAGVSVDERGLGFEDLGQRGRDGGNPPGRPPETMAESPSGLDVEPLAPVRTGPIRLTAEPGRLDILT